MAEELEHDDDPDGRPGGHPSLEGPQGIDPEHFLGRLADSLDHANDPARADAAPRAWVPLGPRNVGGRIRCLALDPVDARVLYAGSAQGGVWRTLDGGDSWAPLDDFREPGAANPRHLALPIGFIAVAPSNRDLIYAGTGEPHLLADGTGRKVPGFGFFRSTNRGLHFERLASPSAGTMRAESYERILVDPNEPDRYWIACHKGLFRHEPGAADFIREVVKDGDDDASDVAIDFGPRGAPPDRYTVYAALRGKGIYRNVFVRGTHSYALAAWERLDRGLPKSGDFHRAKIALCRDHPRTLYAVFGLEANRASRVYRSTDGGDRWERTGTRAEDEQDSQSAYDLVLEVHPESPDTVFVGIVNLHRSVNGGESWSQVMRWQQYPQRELGVHGDQHAVLFDPVDPRTVWAGHDGGVSQSRNLGGTWRKRSHGILAAQLYALAVHPRFPMLLGGGMQDNGTWIGFGGPTWFQVSGGDGGAMGFDPADPRRPLTTVQGKMGTQRGVKRVILRGTTFRSGSFANPAVDVPLAPSTANAAWSASDTTELETGFDSVHQGPFTGILAHHPVRSDHALVGRKRAAYLTTDGVAFTRLHTGDFSPAGATVSCVAYAPTAPDDEWWLGTTEGQVLRTTDGHLHGAVPAETWTAVTPPGNANLICRVAVHPSDPAIVAVATAGDPAEIFLSGDRGVTWLDISGNLGSVVPSVAADRLGPAPVTSLAFDPDSPAGHAAQTLFAGTLAGVYVCRNVLPPDAAHAPGTLPAPVWRTFNQGLPLILIYDLVATLERNAGLAIDRKLLRCSTFGRGVYECDLSPAPRPAVHLYLRHSPADDGRPHAPAAIPPDDPRFGPAQPLDPRRSIDIRIDAAPFQFLEETIDGVELEEQVRSRRISAGERHLIYVQAHTAGEAEAAGVEIHLFWARSPGTPPVVPNLQADFWAPFPAPPGSAPWEPVAPLRTVTLRPGHPAVAAFEWTAPGDLADSVAFLALCRHGADDLLNPLPVELVVANLVRDERRAALRLATTEVFTADLYIRDGVDDTGPVGAVAWGGRSPDLVVVQTLQADPFTAFADLGAQRPGDRVRGGVANHLYVRVHNRNAVASQAEVAVFEVPIATLQNRATWVQIGGAGPFEVPAEGWTFAPVVTWNPADPDPGAPAGPKPYALVAVVRHADDSPADFTTVTDLDGFWNALRFDTGADNAALRVLLFEA